MYSLTEIDIKIQSDIKPDLKVLSYNKLKSIFNECDLLSKNVEDYLQDDSWRNGDHKGTYTKVNGEHKCIMRGMTETVGSGKLTFAEVCNNYNFFNAVEKLVRRCNNGVLQQFSMSINQFGKVTLQDFIFG